MAEKSSKKRKGFDFDFAATTDTTQRRSREIAQDGSRLVQAWGEAAVELWAGAPRVMGDLVNDMTDAVVNSDRDDDRSGVFEFAAGAMSDMSRYWARGWLDSAKVLTDSFRRFSDVYEEREKGRSGKATSST